MLKIITIEVSPFMQNARILACMQTAQAVVIDPGADADLIISHLKKHKLNCQQIWLTHSHLDHCGGVVDLQAQLSLKLYADKSESFFRSRVEETCLLYGIDLGIMKNCPEPDFYITEDLKLQVGDYTFQPLFTPGHSPGHYCFYSKQESLLIAGDTLFSGSIGRTDLPGGNHAQLISSIKFKILNLPGETRVLSGHGADTTVAAEAATNPFLN